MDYEEYLQQRELLESENQNLTGVALNRKEEQAEVVLKEIKEEYKAQIPPMRRNKMNLLAYRELWDTRLYQTAKRIPKGSDLHVHATSLVPAHRLTDFVAARQELTVSPDTCRIYNVREPHPDNCRPLAELLESGVLTRSGIEEKWTMLGKKHNQNVWEYFESLFVLFDSLEYAEETLYHYYLFVFEYYLENNVQHIEIHAVFSEDYNRTLLLAGIIKRAYHEVKKGHPQLIVSVICAGLKYLGIDEATPRLYLENALKLREAVIDDFHNESHPFIIGFDLLNEEDNSVPLKDLAPFLLDCREKHPDFNLYIHCGESLEAQSNNLIDAYLLDAARVGHGMNLYRFPELLNRYAKKEICLESCLISNKTLGYVKDLRLHPAFEYLRRGVTVALCSDDPVCQEHETLTDDFFAAIACWDLSLSDIKQLCINSILYAGIDKAQKRELMVSWKSAWDEFIDEFIK